jgi:hypothetical protein
LVFEHYARAKKKNLKWNSNPTGIGRDRCRGD